MVSSLLHSLVSRDGYVVVDDTHHPHLDDSTWPWVVNTTYPQPNASDCTPIPPEQVWGGGAVTTRLEYMAMSFV